MREFKYQGEGKITDRMKQAAQIHSVVAPMSRKVKDVLKDVTIRQGGKSENGYSPASRTIYLSRDASKKIIEHEIGHAVEEKLFDGEKVREFKRQLVSGLTIEDVRVVKGETGNGRKKDIYVIKSSDLIDIYQGRIYADRKEDCVDADGNIDIDRMEEFISVAFQYYQDFPWIMRKRFPAMYKLVEESVE